MQVSETMNRGIASIDPNAMIREAARVMRDEDLGALVVMEGGRPIGMVTDRDILVRAIASEKGLGTTAVREVMSAGIVSCLESDSVEDAARAMAERKVRRMPVVDSAGNLVGILGTADLARHAEPGAVKHAIEKITEPTVGPRT